MIIPEFKNNKMQMNIIWSGQGLELYDSPGYLKWLAGLQRRHRSIKYSDSQGNKYQGIITNNAPSLESFAVYIKELYGDGFYYCPVNENDMTEGMYLVIIKDGMIMPGSDVIYDCSFFRRIDEARDNSAYSALTKIALDEHHFNEIADRYKKNVLVVQRKRKILYASFSLCMVIFSLVLYTIASIILSR